MGDNLELQTTFNNDTVEDLIEGGTIENVEEVVEDGNEN